MAYNLESLVKILQEILHPDEHGQPWILDPTKEPLIESLLAKATFIIECFDNFPLVTGDQVRKLESRIRDATCHAENIIQSHIGDQLLLRKKGERIMISPPDLLQVVEDYQFERIVDEMVTIMDGGLTTSASSSSRLISRNQDLNPEKLVVGMDEGLLQLKDWLTSHQSNLEIRPILGMGGIGKTTLAQTLYDDLLIASHFDVRAWVVISQSYNVQDVLSGLLKCVVAESTFGKLERIEDLGLCLYQFLCHRRYLIVLDDMRSSEVWDSIRRLFPDDNNRSRIMVTTRELSVATYASTRDSYHQMNFLNDVESQRLLCNKVFAEENFPPELEETGKIIVHSCRGLPLSIHVVGGVLSRLERTQEAWKEIAEDVYSSMVENNDQFLNILSVSYNHLPNYLRPCFLHMSAFPEDYKVEASRLVMLWVAEGFLRPISGMSWEDVAKMCLEELVQRNLLLVCATETERKAKRYTMHDSLRHFCIKKAEDEKFLRVVINEICDLNQEGVLHPQRLSIVRNSDHTSGNKGLANNSRSLTDIRAHHQYYIHLCLHELPTFHYTSGLTLLRVLDIVNAIVREFPEIVENLVNLRYLATKSQFSNIPSSLSRLCNLQTFIHHSMNPFSHKVEDLFQNQKLRYVKFKWRAFLFCDLSDGKSIVVQENLHTLSPVVVGKDILKILEAIPNVKNLGICGIEGYPYSSTIDLRCLTMLETLKCRYFSVRTPDTYHSSVLPYLCYPLLLKKLSLRQFIIPLNCMESIGALPYLQSLKLKNCQFEKQTWEPAEGGFSELRFLLLVLVDLVNWTVSKDNFPKLEKLIIRLCHLPEQISCDVGDIDTLGLIEVSGCNESTEKWAREVQEEQVDYGNSTLQVRITTSYLGFVLDDVEYIGMLDN